MLELRGKLLCVPDGAVSAQRRDVVVRRGLPWYQECPTIPYRHAVGFPDIWVSQASSVNT